MFQNTESKRKTRSLVIEKLKLIFSSSSGLKIFMSLGMTGVFIHLAACLWIYIEGMEIDRSSWLSESAFREETQGYPLDNARIYLLSVYWTVVTLVSVGFGDITPKNTVEKIFTVCFLIFGVGIYTSTISLLSSLFFDPE